MSVDINNLIIKDLYEDESDFIERKEVTLKIYNYNVNPMTSVVLGRMIINKNKLGVTYDDDIENLISKFK